MMLKRLLLVVLTLLWGAPGAQAAAPPGLQSLDEVAAALPHGDAAGVVVDEQGRPVAGAEVFLYFERGLDGFRDRLAGKTTTGADGKFRFRKAVVWEPPVFSMPRYQAQRYDVIARHPAWGIAFNVIQQEDPADAIKVTMIKEKPVNIAVEDKDGEPVEGARVFLDRGQSNGRANPNEQSNGLFFKLARDIGLSSGVTDKAGKVTLPGIRGAEFCAVKEGYAKGWGWKIRLLPGARITGRVTDPDGHGVAGLPVSFRYRGKSINYGDRAITGEDGRYVLDNLPGAGFYYGPLQSGNEVGAAGDVTLIVDDVREGTRLTGMAERFQLKPGDRVTRDLKLAPGVLLAGKVVDAATGRPVPGFHLLRWGNTLDGGRGFETDDQGCFRLRYPVGTAIGIAPETSREGNYILERGQSGGMEIERTMTADVTDLVLRVKIWRVGPLRGTVLAPDGKPSTIPCSVYVHGDVPAVKTDTTGHFTLKSAPCDRDFELLAVAPSRSGAALVHCQAGTTSVTLRLQPLRYYAGLAQTPDGLPADYLIFNLALKLNNSFIADMNQPTTTDAMGKFSVWGLLPAATYEAAWSFGQMQSGYYTWGHAPIDLAALKENEPIKFVARKYANTLTGRVVDEQGKPIEGAKFEVTPWEMKIQSGEANRQPISDKNGNFMIDHVASGHVMIKVSHAQYKSRIIRTANDNGNCSVTLAPRDAEVVSTIRVVDEKGNPQAHAAVILSTKRYGGMVESQGVTTQTLTTDARGQIVYRRRGAQSGLLRGMAGTKRQHVICDQPGYDLAFSGLPTEEDSDLMLVLRKGGPHWHGVICDENGKPLAGAVVEINAVIPSVSEAFSLYWLQHLQAISGADGQFEFPRIGTRNGLTVLVSAPGYASEWHDIESSSQPQPMAFKLAREAVIAGRVILRPTGEAMTTGTLAAFRRERGGNESNPFDKHGAFRIDGLQPGEYMLRYLAPSPQDKKWIMISNPSVLADQGTTRTVTVELEEGFPVRVRAIEAATGKPPREPVRITIQGQNTDIRDYDHVKPGETWQTWLVPGRYQIQATRLINDDYRPSASDPVKTIEIERGKNNDTFILEFK